MIKNTLIITLSTLIFISCSTSTKTASTKNSSTSEQNLNSKKNKADVAITNKDDSSKNLKGISISDSKKAVHRSKLENVQKVK